MPASEPAGSPWLSSSKVMASIRLSWYCRGSCRMAASSGKFTRVRFEIGLPVLGFTQRTDFTRPRAASLPFTRCAVLREVPQSAARRPSLGQQ
ncbi:hypothetical protein [Streptomyces cavernae]|uniref:hypothetical protein n=1 Tax=Streptomyces cavernae TaxID=2259034 RepID=UPI0030B832ED